MVRVPCCSLTIRIAVALGAVCGAGLLDARGSPAHADWRQAAPWCAAMGGSFGGWDCSYYTFEQCMATARGLGNFCSPNPRAAYDPYQRSRARRYYR